MGTVWMADQTEPVKRTVAVKLIRVERGQSKTILARFEAERQAIALMDHPHIAKLLDAGTTETGSPFFVMELVKGVPLTDFCDAHRLTVHERLNLLRQICSAVQHAHQKGGIHRDLKPRNVLVTEVDGRPTPKVIDFGVAKATEQKLTDLSFSDVGAIVGTPAYMSPEQADPSSMDIDTRTDVYALGVILYELLTGSPPIDSKAFKRGALLEMLRMVREVEPPRPSTKLSTADALPNIAANRSIEPARLAKLLQGELDWVVMKALEKDRTRRYDTANGLARDVQRYLADEVVEARPPSRGYRLKKYVKRNKGPVVAASFVLLALIGGVIGTSIGMVQAENERQRSVELAQKNAAFAEDEAKAKDAAKRLAVDNAKLALDEREAKLKAIEATNAAVRAQRDQEKQFQRARAALFTSQMNRAEPLRESDPAKALELLHDLDACPIELRDAAWCFAVNACKRRTIGSIPYADSVVGLRLSPNGKFVAISKLPPHGTRTVKYPLPGTIEIVDRVTGKSLATLPEMSAPSRLFEFSPDSNLLAVSDTGPPPSFVPEQEAKPGKVILWDIVQSKVVAVLDGHTRTVNALAFHPDSAQLATGSVDGTARIWDAKSGKSVHELKGHGKEVAAVAFHPDGKRLATGGLDNTIRLWEVSTGKPASKWTASVSTNPEYLAQRKQRERIPLFVAEGVLSLDFSPDGRLLAAGNANRQIELWDITAGSPRTTLREGRTPALKVRFHRTGRLLAVNNETIWDIDTGAKWLTLGGLPGVSNASFTPEQNLFVSNDSRGGTGGVLELIDLDAPLESARFEIEKHQINVQVVAFHPAGEALAVGCGTGVHLFDLRTGQLRQLIKGHERAVSAIAFSPDGTVLATASSARVYSRIPFGGVETPWVVPKPEPIRLWKANTGEPVGTLDPTSPNTMSMAFSRDGTTLAATHWDFPKENENIPGVTLWDTKTRTLRSQLELPSANGSLLHSLKATVLFHPRDGSLITVVGRFAQVWDTGTRTVRKQFVTQAGVAFFSEHLGAASVSPDGNLLAAVLTQPSRSSEVVCWDLNTGEQLYRRPLASPITDLQFTRDGKNLAVRTGLEVQFWDSLTMQPRLSFKVADTLGSSGLFAVSSDGQLLATATSIRTNNPQVPIEKAFSTEIKLWNLSRSPVQAVFSEQAHFDFTPDSRTVVVSDARELRFWDPIERRNIANIEVALLPRLMPAVSPDGSIFAGGAAIVPPEAQATARFGPGGWQYPGIVILWDTRTGRELRRIEPGRGIVLSLAFSPDGNSLVVVQKHSEKNSNVWDAETIIRMVDVATGRVTAEFPFKNTSGTKVAISPDGKALAFSNFDDSIRLVDLASGKSLSTLPAVPERVIEKTRPGAPNGAIIDTGPGGDGRDVVRFTADGSRLVVRRARTPDTVVVWDWRAGKQVQEQPPEVQLKPDFVNESPDGRFEFKRFLGNLSRRIGYTELWDRAVKPPVLPPRKKP